MNFIDILIVRIYISESSRLLKSLIKYLQEQARVRGVTVFRGISGFGDSGKIHETSLIDLSLDLPLVIEFFDEPNKIMEVLEHLKIQIKPEHIVYWQAQANLADTNK
jgi:uncharacterized protein